MFKLRTQGLVMIASGLVTTTVAMAATAYPFQVAQQLASVDQKEMSEAALRTFEEGVKLRFQGTAESLNQSIGKFEEALRLWQILEDKPKQALALSNLGYVYFTLDKYPQALDYLNRALPLTSEKQEVAVILGNIGAIYHQKADYQQALKYYQQALGLQKAIGGLDEFRTLIKLGVTYSALNEHRQSLEYYKRASDLVPSSSGADGRIEIPITDFMQLFVGMATAYTESDTPSEAGGLMNVTAPRAGVLN